MPSGVEKAEVLQRQYSLRSIGMQVYDPLLCKRQGA